MEKGRKVEAQGGLIGGQEMWTPDKGSERGDTSSHLTALRGCSSADKPLLYWEGNQFPATLPLPVLPHPLS